ncbi:hypothetical protein AMOR_04680 [Anaeromyxobacter oryzae]|uniref:Uncharacterized protein n=1 Tax=Anaeromyxobacter oryzae TaxID=2918170 RepID=A0ABM7WPS3_9BACT|nr:hypothetical protein AMOR_04680 [Anaeromyxobacter oryzae]
MRRLLLHGASLAVAAAAFAAHEHFKLHGASTESLVTLLAAAGFGLSPVRALAREVFAIEGKLLHLVHGLGALGMLGLTLGGVISGRPILEHGLAPFAIMGAAQAVMHQDRPRSPEQAAALRRFATSLPEVRQLTRSGGLDSPANARRAVAVLTELVGKAQALGETELRADPAFQGAMSQAMTRLGLSLGLDTVDEAIGELGASPAAASAVPELRKRLAAARHALDRG